MSNHKEPPVIKPNDDPTAYDSEEHVQRDDIGLDRAETDAHRNIDPPDDFAEKLLILRGTIDRDVDLEL